MDRLNSWRLARVVEILSRRVNKEKLGSWRLVD